MKTKPKIKQTPFSASDKVLDATSLIFAQGNKITASEVTENVKCAYQKTVATFESLTINEMAMVLLKRGRRERMIKQSAPSVVFYAAEERLSELSQERHRIDADIGTAAKVMAMYEKERGDNLAIMQDLAKWLGDQHSESESDPDAYFRIYNIPKQTSAGGESE